MAGAAVIGVSCEISPRSDEVPEGGPAVIEGSIDVYLVRRVGRGSPTPHHEHVGRDVWQSKRKCPCFACTPRYVGKSDNKIACGVVFKRIVGVDKRSAIPVAAPTRVDAVTDYCYCGSRYKAARDRQHRILQHPDVSCGSKLPDLIGHRGVNPEAAQDVELVVVHGEPTR
jgi:hypothetical protein